MSLVDDTTSLTAYAFLVQHWRGSGGVLPMSTERPCTTASNSEVRRWLQSKAVEINGERPQPNDPVSFPVTHLVFFPNGQRRTTYQ